MRLLELLGFSTPSIGNSANVIELNGPFLEEDSLLKDKDKHLDLLKKTIYKCNLIISRDILILSEDKGFSARDDVRVELGITHHIHQLEFYFKDFKDFDIIGIDRFIILNPVDSFIIKDYILNHPLTTDEIKGFFSL